MVGQHNRLNGLEFKQTPGDTEGWGSLACCCPWGHRVGHDLVTEQQQMKPAGIVSKHLQCFQMYADSWACSGWIDWLRISQGES